MIDTNEMRNSLGEALVTPGLTILALLDEIDRLRAKPKPQRIKYDRASLAAPYWTEYNGTRKTMPPLNKYVLVTAKAGWRDYDKCRNYCGDFEWRSQGLPLEVGDRWMLWPEGK